MRIFLVLLALLSLAGCAGQVVSAPPSHALVSQESSLTRHVAALAAAQPPGYSGFRLLPASAEAFAARVRMIRAAETSLDVQYYIVHDGISTRTLIDELLAAADRGVRVRLLLDDTTSDGSDYQIATLAAHRNIFVRVFNPLHVGRSNIVTRSLGRLLHLSQQHRRMHNKLMLADSSLAIVGGRNLGDEYFDADKGLNFTDLDLLAAGPVARQLATSFDQYWNHPLSVPIQHFLSSPPRRHALSEARQQITRYLRADRQRDPQRYQHLVSELDGSSPEEWLHGLVWAHGEALWDHPEKINASGIPDERLLLTTRLQPTMDAVSREMTLISAYFVPTEEGVNYLTARARNGVAIRILTNSLEATDVPIVHGGYAPYRRPLLEAGVRLFELRRQPDQEPSYNLGGESESSLHSKAAVFDRQEVFLGSLNFDPRSVLWNTEVGVLIESAELASEVQRLTLEGTSPAVSYEVRLVRLKGRERLIWIAEDDNHRKVLLKEPGGTWRRFNAWISRVIGLERML